MLALKTNDFDPGNSTSLLMLSTYIFIYQNLVTYFKSGSIVIKRHVLASYNVTFYDQIFEIRSAELKDRNNGNDRLPNMYHLLDYCQGLTKLTRFFLSLWLYDITLSHKSARTGLVLLCSVRSKQVDLLSSIACCNGLCIYWVACLKDCGFFLDIWVGLFANNNNGFLRCSYEPISFWAWNPKGPRK